MTGPSASQKVEEVDVTIQQESYHPPLTLCPLLDSHLRRGLVR